MKLVLISFFTILSLVGFSSENKAITGRILDQNQQPLAFVNIGVLNTQYGTTTNAHGDFQLFLPDVGFSVADSVRFSMVGYHAQTLALSALKGQKHIEVILIPKLETLPSVTVSTKKLNRKTMGLSTVGAALIAVSYGLSDLPNGNLGSEIGRRFNISRPQTKLEKFRFYLLHNNFDTAIFRINVYSLKKGKPDANLLNKNIIVHVLEKQKGWIEVDLRPYNLYVDDDVVVSAEWVGKSEKGKYLMLPLVMPTSATHFYKFGSQNKWKRFRSMVSVMQLTVCN
jgi:hypothetical protein